MEGAPSTLPLMSFALRDLFEAEKTRQGEAMALTLPAYQQRGGYKKRWSGTQNVFLMHLTKRKSN